MTGRRRDRITIDTPFGPVTLVADEQGTARGATPLDTERWARFGDNIGAAIVASQMPRARRKLSLRELRSMPARRRRQTADATAAATAARKVAQEKRDDADRPKVRRLHDDGTSKAEIARKLHMNVRRVRRLLGPP